MSARHPRWAGTTSALAGYRPGTTERLGLGPGLVCGRMTGCRQDGALAQRAGHKVNYIALTSALHAMGPAALLDGAAPFYRTYECCGGGHIAVGAIEPPFYALLLKGLDLDVESVPDRDNPAAWPELAEMFAATFATRSRGRGARCRRTGASVLPYAVVREGAAWRNRLSIHSQFLEDTLITVTAHEQFQAWKDKVLPAVEEVRPGVWSIPVPFINNPMRYTLSYLLVGDGEAALVDPGWDSDEGWDVLKAGLAVAGLGPKDITGIVVTHFHPDHLGMAARLRAASGAWVALSENEPMPTHWRSDPERFVAEDRAQFAAWGVPAEFLDEVSFQADTWARITSVEAPQRRLADGGLLPIAGLTVRVLSTPGHTPGHICLVDEANQLILTGDHVLPRITPHVSLEAQNHANPLGDYFDSLQVMAVGAAMEVLPGHEYRFRGLPQRVDELTEHTLERSREVIAVLESGTAESVWDVSKQLTWSRGFDSLRGFTLRLALAETASHLVYLESTGMAVDVKVSRGAPSIP
ncbi:MBL fold metallo-hydrolase [Arthrobacter sp. LAPM80]|uniref:MBL fold metallo-hydrolase n=1 Tax=Arthrobacter sp. LAPM80 TaxID=3141788 RepID=UPI00398A9CE5